MYDFVTRVLGREEVEGKRILEVGALDVNGSVRPYITSLKPAEYIGIDRRAGRRVDRKLSAEYLVEAFGCDQFDVVLCIETLEHIRHWRRAMVEMLYVLKIGGLLVLTTRSPGFPRHDHPDDFWRFDIREFRSPWIDWFIVDLQDDHEAPGILLAARKTAEPFYPQFDRIRAIPAPA